jgi:hypothetical protein
VTDYTGAYPGTRVLQHQQEVQYRRGATGIDVVSGGTSGVLVVSALLV